MSWAHISTTGQILQTLGKIPMGLRLQPGERMIPFNWPNVDKDLVEALPVTPVPEDAEEVTFVLYPFSDAAQILERRCIAQIDADVDKIYALAIGNRGTEYAQAEAEATAYRDAGYTGDVPHFVQYWATAKSQTATWAADDILAQSVAWRGAAAAIREHRLQAKESVRAGTVEAAMTAWNGFVAFIYSSLGI